jgi:hypothetical protein
MPQVPERKDTVNHYERDKAKEEIQLHNSKTAHDQNQADAKHSGHKGRPTKGGKK